LIELISQDSFECSMEMGEYTNQENYTKTKNEKKTNMNNRQSKTIEKESIHADDQLRYIL